MKPNFFTLIFHKIGENNKHFKPNVPRSMTENIPENITSASEEEWAIFPFDQTADGRRWVKLIEDINALATEAESNQFTSDEYSVEGQVSQINIAESRFSSAEEGFFR